VVADAVDENAAAPVLARYAREGARVFLVIATDGAQGGAHTSIPRGAERRVPFSTVDFEASRRSMACHKTQFSDDIVQRVSEAQKGALKGELRLAPLFPTAATTDLFR